MGVMVAAALQEGRAGPHNLLPGDLSLSCLLTEMALHGFRIKRQKEKFQFLPYLQKPTLAGIYIFCIHFLLLI